MDGMSESHHLLSIYLSIYNFNFQKVVNMTSDDDLYLFLLCGVLWLLCRTVGSGLVLLPMESCDVGRQLGQRIIRSTRKREVPHFNGRSTSHLPRALLLASADHNKQQHHFHSPATRLHPTKKISQNLIKTNLVNTAKSTAYEAKASGFPYPLKQRC